MKSVTYILFLISIALICSCDGKSNVNDLKSSDSEEENESINSNLELDATLKAYQGVVFQLKKTSKKYDIIVYVKSCEDTYCEGSGKIELYEKGTTHLVQVFPMKELYVELSQGGKMIEGVNQMYGDNGAVIMYDFNFDGTEDLAIRDGNYGAYGGPSFNVFVYHSTKKKFVKSEELTELASMNLGFFDVDKKEKRLTTFSKDGCCWHIATKYAIDKKKGLIKVYESIEDGTNEGVIISTERKLIKNQWVESIDTSEVNPYE
ncbi:MAG: XAC2610-related protein [Flavobacteriia bacterium]